MMNAVNTEFSFVEVWFTDETSKALEIQDNVNLTYLKNTSCKQRINMRYSTEPRFRKYFIVFCHLQENLVINMVKN